MGKKETWKAIPGWEGRYEVSDQGQVRSWYYGKKHLDAPRVRKPAINRYGYLQLDLKAKGRIEYWCIHQLVALCFIPNLEGFDQVNHIDGNKLNNMVSNLEWVSGAQNKKHAWDNGLISKEALSEGQKRRYKDPLERSRASAIQKAVWDNPEYAERMRSKLQSEEHVLRLKERRALQAPPTKGRKRIHKGPIEKVVQTSELQKYLSDGWIIGRRKQ